MTVEELKKMASGLGIKTAGLRKAELIKAIQVTEGSPACFSMSPDSCDEILCLFREDCRGL